ncbi:Zinc knuckle [Popillia japonica]|uniref:Zinc knuckle n=1 Tax=Popillia japonica TaxID=7064 RepID=A0AAW1JEF4_POPJA
MGASSECKVSVDKLEGPNDWAKWKWHMSMVLRSYGLEDIVSGVRKCVVLPVEPKEEEKTLYAAWQKDDAKAASLLASAVSRSVAELVLTCNNAKEIWDKLHARFERSSTQRLNMLIESVFCAITQKKFGINYTRDLNKKKEWVPAKIEEKLDYPRSYLVKDEDGKVYRRNSVFLRKSVNRPNFRGIDKELDEAGKKGKEFEERILNGRILSTLGKEFDNFKDIWDTIPSENQKLNLLIEKLCTIELRDQSSTEASAFVASGKRKQFKKDKLGKPKLSMERAKQKFPCNKCKQVGHWAAECPQWAAECPQKKIGGSNYQANKRGEGAAFISCVMGASTGNYIDANMWYCDSGATKHITPNKQNFISYSEFSVPEVISLGKQEVIMHAYGQGMIKIQIRRDNTWDSAEMRNVLYVPDASANLFS